ncbi:hypothetical protein IscW_ISCW004660 [Ixodes scapularis]|uniref:Uncharacterized protein n=1 Tax=Ixodes scapularis TaxID=6945 RepID=B7PK20_IXOSC|nr:hypothetical protein IscW_ISCW004660 [Ixodes scapularis]|eukprot:XP_002409146.1 hypothetical protein IscW_ISCW004660 [Ixodes scapularis]
MNPGHDAQDGSPPPKPRRDANSRTDDRRPGPSGAGPSIVDEFDVLTLRFLEFVHRTLLYGMELLRTHGHYAYSTS